MSFFSKFPKTARNVALIWGKRHIVSSDSNTAAGNHSAIRLFSRGRLMGLGGEIASLE